MHKFKIFHLDRMTCAAFVSACIGRGPYGQRQQPHANKHGDQKTVIVINEIN